MAEQRHRRVGLMHVVTVPESFAFLRGQLGYMRQRDYDISLVASPGELVEVVREAEQLPVYTVEMPRRVTPLNDLRAVLRLARLMRRLAPTIVHAHTPKGGLLGMIAAVLARVPVRIYHMRGLPLETAAGRLRTVLTLTERISCALATRVICVSPSLRQVALDHGLVPPEKALIMAGGSGNGVDALGRFAPRDDDAEARASLRATLGIAASARVVLYCGRLVRDKGLHELADAWRTLQARYPGTVLLVVGREEEKQPEGLARLAALHADPSVRMIGSVADTRAYLVAADLLVLPTYREGFPNVLLEAAAMSLPVVATRVTGCVDAVVDGVTGLLVPVRDVDSLVEATGRYLEDPALRRRHGAAGRALVLRDYEQTHIWRAIEELYRELMRMAPHAEPAAVEQALVVERTQHAG